MKLKKIVANDIKKCHPNQNPSQTDQYYQRLANRLQDSFCSLGVTIDEFTDEVIHRSAIVLTNYMEDIVADSGQWCTFSNLCQKLYGHPVPLYHENEEYYPDEPSLNAIRYLLWSVVSDVSKELAFSDSTDIRQMSLTAYNILEEAFEEAPVNEQLASDVKSKLVLATEGFDKLRNVLTWLFTDCYLTSGEQNSKLFSRHVEELADLADITDMPELSPEMALFYANTKSIFSHQIGPLALYPKDYLAAMMRTKDMEHQAEDVDKIEMLDTGVYKYEPVKTELELMSRAPMTERMRLTRTNGKEIEIDKEELNLSEKMLKKFDGFMASSFVFYLGEWHLNGILFPFPEISKKWEKLCADDKENLKPVTTTFISDMILKRTNGQQMAYFANREQMVDFLVRTPHFPRQILAIVNVGDGEFPVLFIDTEEQKNCLQFIYGYSPCIADPDNPFYDEEKAREIAVDMLWDAESVSTHALKYLLEHNYLPDIYDDEILSRFSTPAEKRLDIDFLMRFYRREKY